ncbi:MAG: hypothetical protein MI739_12630 [Bacteroidales bacterium]|nr:hypothetical protein [Bacteroidales bacterium]
MKNLFYSIIALLMFFSSCKKDEKTVVELASFSYGTSEYNVLVGKGAKSVKATVAPKEAKYFFQLETITKNGAAFDNKKNDFILNKETGLVEIDKTNQLTEDVYAVKVKVINSNDEKDFKTASLTFNLIKKQDLQSVSYSKSSYTLLKGKSIVIEAPVVDPQGIPLLNTISILKEGKKIETDEIKINDDGSISISENNNLEAGTYLLTINAVNKWDETDKYVNEIGLKVYNKLESIVYPTKKYTIESGQGLNVNKPVVNPKSVEVVFLIEKIEKNNKEVNLPEVLIADGKISIPWSNRIPEGVYTITIRATNANDDQNVVTTKIQIIVTKPSTDPPVIYYPIKPHVYTKGQEYKIPAPTAESEGWEFELKEIIEWQNNGMSEEYLGSDIVLNADGSVTAKKGNTLTGSTYEIHVIASKGTENVAIVVYLNSPNAHIRMSAYADIPAMGGVEIDTSISYSFNRITIIPNNLSNMKIKMGKVEINDNISCYELFDWEKAGIILDEKTGQLIIPADALPREYKSKTLGFVLANYIFNVEFHWTDDGNDFYNAQFRLTCK